MLWVLEVSMRLAIGRVGTEIGATDGWSCEHGRRGGRDAGWCDCARDRCSGHGASGRRLTRSRLTSGVGAMEASAADRGREAAILVSSAEVESELLHGFGGLSFRAPFTTRNFEESRGKDEVVAQTNVRGGRRDVVTSGDEADAIVELSKKLVNGGSWWVPRSMHTEGVCVQFALSDGAPSRPKVDKNGETRDAAEAEFGISKAAKIVRWNGSQELIAKGFVRFHVGAKDELIIVKNAVDLGDLGASGGDGIHRLARAVNGGDEGNAARAKKVGGGREGERKVAMDTITFVRGNGDGVAV